MENSISKLAVYFPRTTSHSLIGDVSSNSKVPNFCSSANNLIVSSGAKNTTKKLDHSASPLTPASEKGLVISKTKNTPVNIRNKAPTT